MGTSVFLSCPIRFAFSTGFPAGISPKMILYPPSIPKTENIPAFF
jgi:hypothetical protein